MKRVIELALFLVLLLLISGFVAQNPERTSIAFFPEGGKLTLPLGLVVLGSFAIGVVVGTVFTWLGLLRRLIAPWRNARRIAALERELAALRAQGAKPASPSSPSAPLPLSGRD